MRKRLKTSLKFSTRLLRTVLHNRHAAAGAVVNPNQAQATARPTVKPFTAELKTRRLAHDTSMANLRTWKKNSYKTYKEPLSRTSRLRNSPVNYARRILNSVS